MTDDPFLTGGQIRAKVHTKIDEYKERSMLEQYAIFMGKVQILEFGLKGLLTRRYGVPPEDMERWTLGRTKSELKDRGLRTDYILLLQSLIGHRNNMAHEFLVNNAITRSIANFSEFKLCGDLFRAVYELEQAMILYDWCEENDAW